VARRSYAQACTLARTLDLVGERWTLLLLRELMLGPKRFTDLLDGLPGIGRNLLSDRLHRLELEGLIVRGSLPPPAASRVYELTEAGKALGPAMAELGRWGAERLGPAPSNHVFRPAWAVFPLSYMANHDAARGVRESYEFRIDGEAFQPRVDDGRVEPRAGGGDRPVLVITTDTETLLELLSGELAPLEALEEQRVTVEGPPAALQRCLSIVGGESASS
jgi:DNA-binding HxlR family transcriptional regulator